MTYRLIAGTFALSGLLVVSSVWAQASVTPTPVPRSLSFEQASQDISSVSNTLSGAAANVRAARDNADSLRSLHHPLVSVDAQELAYQKTLDLSLAGLKSQASSSASSALSGIDAVGVPGVSPSAVGAVTSQVQQALPSIFASIPNTVSLRTNDTLFHPTATAIVQIYTGGAIAAAQDAAKAAVKLARAQQASAEDTTQLELVRDYFGQVLAAEVLAIGTDTRDGFDRHLADALKLEQQGVISRGQRLQVEVARDTAQRALDREQGDSQTAVDTLAEFIHGDAQGVSPTTPLFVSSQGLGSVTPFVDAAEADHPQLRQAEAEVEAARQGVKLEHARELPTVYAFGEYNFDRHDELPTEPDWIFGLGVHYTLLSNVDRRKSESAARERQRATEATERQTRVDLRTNITRAYNLVETARRQFLDLDSSLAATAESLRVQELSFREGEATSTDVIDARNALGQARAQRAAAAYEYDLSLAALLLASGQMPRFIDYLHDADKRLVSP